MPASRSLSKFQFHVLSTKQNIPSSYCIKLPTTGREGETTGQRARGEAYLAVTRPLIQVRKRMYGLMSADENGRWMFSGWCSDDCHV